MYVCMYVCMYNMSYHHIGQLPQVKNVQDEYLDT